MVKLLQYYSFDKEGGLTYIVHSINYTLSVLYSQLNYFRVWLEKQEENDIKYDLACMGTLPQQHLWPRDI